VGCGISKNKSGLIRVVRSPDGELSIDLKGKKSGRGAYICMDEECLKKALKARKFERSLEITIPDELAENLLQQIKNYEL
jgi:predicted RNA-binding protein YlxR (DUF448 family)